MAKPRADQETLDKVHRVLADAAARGVDPALALDDAALLWTDRRYREAVAASVTVLATLLDETALKQIAAGERMPTSPMDTKRLIIGWLRKRAQGIVEGGIR